MYRLNDKIRDLEPYEPIAGTYKIRLDANESYLGIPEYITAEMMAKLIHAQLNRYPDSGASALCEAFAALYKVKKENVVAGNGSDELISVILGGFLMKGETLATLELDFSMYDFYGSICEVNRIVIPKNGDHSIDVPTVIGACKKSGVKLLIFSNPCNPTSLGLDKADVKKIIKALPDTLVVVDEAYMDFWNQSIITETGKFDNLLVLRTCSKALGLAGMRIGFAVGNPALISAIKAIKSPYNLNTVSQVLAETFLHHRGETRAALSQIIGARDELYEMLKGLEAKYPGTIEVVLGNTNFVVVKTPEAKEIWEYFLSIGIAVRCFKGFLRITAGSYNENQQTIKFFNTYLSRTKL